MPTGQRVFFYKSDNLEKFKIKIFLVCELEYVVMKLKENQMKHASRFCPTCRTSEHTLFDENRGEIFCSRCGLVLQDTARTSIVELIKEAKRHENDFRIKLNSKLKK